jgi:uncharacterized caspase-like protein
LTIEEFKMDMHFYWNHMTNHLNPKKGGEKRLRNSLIFDFSSSIKIVLLIVLIGMVAGFPPAAGAENHALLIGIGTYKDRVLEGPPYDVAALAKVLKDRFGFAREHIRTLINAQAVKRRILDEFKLLGRRTRPGDRVLIYFSGHGTSRQDDTLALPLPHSSGALVPADFEHSSDQSIESQMDQLIIGRRDLRPTLEQLDRNRQVLMIFDTCFSGNTVRSIASADTADAGRYMRLESNRVFTAEQEIGSFEENLNSIAPYPYQNIFYMSASAENELAGDIRRNNLHIYPTIDGNPHGVLTDALLRVLTGQRPVDTNRDGRWSQLEVYAAVKAEVKRRFNQTPRALPTAGQHVERLNARSFFEPTTEDSTAVAAKPGMSNPKKTRPSADARLDYSSSHALVVGINAYHNWPRLEYAVKDAREMSTLLKAQGFRTHMLLDDRATRANILAGLSAIDRSTDKNSRVVFYFAGHGQTEDLPGGRERGYLVPVDADTYDWQGSMMSMDRLNRIMKEMRAKHILMAFDSCYSGLGLTRSVRGFSTQNDAYIQKMMRSRSVQILTAGSRSEQAIEAAGHGLFTDHLLAALSGAADINEDGYITATEIYATLRPSITRKSHSRQTPLFGYIEGNGDIIFRNTPPETRSSVIIIDTHVSGIDVWAGADEIGYRLPAGRHRLRASAGQTTLIVKKGGLTLYRKSVLLPANQTFPIRIGPTSIPPANREPFSTLTISNQNVVNYANSIAHDLDFDGREEIVTASGRQLYAFKSDGSVVWKKQFKVSISLDLIEDWNSHVAIGLSARDYNKVHLILLDQAGDVIWQHVRKITRYHRGKPDGSGRLGRLADIDGDGREEIIAIAGAQHGLKPRGLIVYNQEGSEVWRYTIGPDLQDIVIWERSDGRPDIIIGTYSPGHGNHEIHNNTSDMQAYVISIDGYGRTNWIRRLGEFYNGIGLLLADVSGNGNRSLFAHKYTSSFFRQDKGTMYRISRSGTILNQKDFKNSIMSITAAESKGGEPGFLYAADNRSNLFRLDGQLRLLQQKSLENVSSPSEVRLVGVHDYTGDGDSDLLLFSFDRLLKDRNPLAPKRSGSNRFYANLTLQIISRDFSRILKKVSLAENWHKQRGFTVKDLNRPETGYYPFMALSDKITIFNY